MKLYFSLDRSDADKSNMLNVVFRLDSDGTIYANRSLRSNWLYIWLAMVAMRWGEVKKMKYVVNDMKHGHRSIERYRHIVRMQHTLHYIDARIDWLFYGLSMRLRVPSTITNSSRVCWEVKCLDKSNRTWKLLIRSASQHIHWSSQTSPVVDSAHHQRLETKRKCQHYWLNISSTPATVNSVDCSFAVEALDVKWLLKW